MAQLAGQMSAQLYQQIHYNLDNEAVENANFLASRLYAIDSRSPDAHHLLALTQLRLRKYKTAYDSAYKYGHTGKNLGCAYVFALACQKLDRCHDGIQALEKARPLWIGRNNWNKQPDLAKRFLPDAAAVLTLLGKLSRGHGDLRKSGEYFVEAHKTNPFTWDAFKGLCDIGAEINDANTFRITPEMRASASPQTTSLNGSKDDAHITLPQAQSRIAESQVAVSTPTNDPFNTKGGNDWSFQFPKLKAKGMFGSPPKNNSQLSFETPTANNSQGDDDIEMGGIATDTNAALNDGPPPAPVRRSKTLSRLGFDTSKDSSRAHHGTLKPTSRTNSDSADAEDTASQSSRTTAVHKRTLTGHAPAASADADTAPPRRSNRLFGQLGTAKTASRLPSETPSIVTTKREAELKKAKAIGTKGRGPSTVGRVVSGNRKIMPPAADTKDNRAPSRNSVTVPPAPATKPAATAVVVPDTAALESLLSMFRQLGIGYSALTKYDSKASIKAFEEVAHPQKDTPWVLAHLGKAYYEAAQYTKAEECFARVMKLEPTRVEDMEYYSTVLWQLKKPVQLAFLAHTLRSLDFEAPQTWCTVGNAFSLNREHDRAIACFKRATQIDPKYYYAWTLMGHELLTNEEFDAAVAAYRKGVGAERRGYTSWYGLGKCYERMGKYEEAERHYRIAAEINSQHSVLFVCIGVVLERLRHPREALAQYTHAITLAPTAAIGRFRRARTLMSLHLHQDALKELGELVTLAPEEANAWYMLGRCHKALGNRGEAVRCLTMALNLDTKATQHIKDALEAIDDSDEEDDSD